MEMKVTFTFLLVILLVHSSVYESLQVHSHLPTSRQTLHDKRPHYIRSLVGQHRHYFQKEDNGGVGKGRNEGENKPPFLSRFVPGIFKKKSEKPATETDTAMRYELRLKDVDIENRRHVTTRLQRYLPDLQFETAQSIVDAAIESELGKSLIRVFNSKNQVEEIADMLSLADPPVITEIYDNRKNEIIS